MIFSVDGGLNFQMEIGPIILDCASLPDPELGTIECILYLQLAARECGAEVKLKNASRRLLELLDFLGIEVERHPKERE